MRVHIIALMLLSLIAGGCNAGSSSKSADETPVVAQRNAKQQFSADSAYRYVKQQVEFGPRVPGTDSHVDCARFLTAELSRHGADTVIEQKTVVTAFNGDRLPIINILGRYNLNASRRVLLVAHWDTRPWADAEKDVSKHSTPIPGANDGGSGVGVLLEIARNLKLESPAVGVDILLTDAEDYGNTGGDDDSWCLGTQYWVKNMPYNQGNLPIYGILLDIVGGIDAKFYREYFSEYYAQPVNDKVWAVAASSGFGEKFINTRQGAVTDDHVYINAAGIPCIDIIECANQATGSFPPTWHTLADDMRSIDKSSLKAVGQTVLNTIYQEPNN
ncbi:MAG: M28 family peptidase [Muribaculaceae bacterium]|nr:M28 family peptidase [Muribaculaceae bacterium]